MEANNRAYISAPISLNWSTVEKFMYAAKGSGFSCRFWKRGSVYDRNLLDPCDTAIFLLPDNKFEISRNEIPNGLSMELSRAYAQNKNIVIGHISEGGLHRFYESKTDGKSIKGITGTSGALRRIKENLEIPDEKWQILDWIDKKIKGFNSEFSSTSFSLTYAERIGEIGKVISYDHGLGIVTVEFSDGIVLPYSAEEAKKHIVYPEYDSQKSAMKITNSSTYGVWLGNPCSEIKLPKVQNVYPTTVPNPDWIEERLLLML